MDLNYKKYYQFTLILLSSFLLAFLSFYIAPALFHGGQQMKQLQLLPFLDPVGADLDIYLRFIESWREGTEFQWSDSNIYPPLNTLIFLPFTWISYLWSFGIITFLSFLSLIFIVLVFPYKMSGEKYIFLLSFPAFILSLMTYPFLFEVERGQFNLIAMAICFLGIQLRSKNKMFSYLCFLFSIQLKLFPAIFVFFFAGKDWKKYLILGGTSFLLLFSLGYKKFAHFLFAIKERSKSDIYVSEVNTSIDSFFRLTEKVMNEWGNSAALNVLPTVEALAYIGMFGVLAVGLYVFFKKESHGVNAAFLLICTIITLLLPQTSHDYKISYLVGPILYFIGTLDFKKTNLVAVWLVGFCYSSMLWHFWEHKQGSQLFRMNTPALFIILFICLIPILDYFKKKNEVGKI